MWYAYENYLAHGATNKKSGRKKGSENKKHKYILKIMNPMGEPRYFYTQEEVEAYYKNLNDDSSDIEDVYTAENTLNTGQEQDDRANNIVLDEVFRKRKFSDINKKTDEEEEQNKQINDAYTKAYDVSKYYLKDKVTQPKIRTLTNTGDSIEETSSNRTYTNLKNNKFTPDNIMNTQDISKTKDTSGSKVLSGKDALKADSDSTHKYVAKIPLGNGSYRYFYDAEEYADYQKRQEYKKDEPSVLKKLPKSTEDYSAQQDAMMVNPHHKWSRNKDTKKVLDDYKSGKAKDYEYLNVVRENAAYTQNCNECTTAYELRRRGYDVEVAPRKTNNAMVSKDLRVWKGAKIKKIKDKSVDKFDRVIEKDNPPKARGNLMVTFKLGGAHSMAYEIDSKGKMHIYDTQTGNERSADYVKNNCKSVYFCRTDNLEPTGEVLSCVEPRKH